MMSGLNCVNPPSYFMVIGNNYTTSELHCTSCWVLGFIYVCDMFLDLFAFCQLPSSSLLTTSVVVFIVWHEIDHLP